MKRLTVLLLLLGMACTQPPRNITPAFYYWKQRYRADSAELRAFAGISAKRLYIRMFDVNWDPARRAAVPLAPLDARPPFPGSAAIVPVVFIMNEVWQHTGAGNVHLLAQQVDTLLQQLCSNIPAVMPEVQLDCDWTRNSRETYFAFLRELRSRPFFSNRQLSVTIRMHQVKYLAASGVPPADKGLLMCYNMGNLRQWGDHNSILNMDDLEAYTGKDRISNYPLPLDLALPLFEWSVLFRRHAYTGLLRNITGAELQQEALFAPAGRQLYTVKKDTLLKGYALRRGDVVRYETCPPALLRKAASRLARQRQPHQPAIIFFHLDALTLQRYNLHELETICNIFR